MAGTRAANKRVAPADPANGGGGGGDASDEPLPKRTKRGVASKSADDDKTETIKTSKSNGRKQADSTSLSPEDDAQAGAATVDSANDDASKFSEAQFAKSKHLRVPLDEECQMPSYRVHIDGSSGIIYDAALNQTNAANNNNKFYKIQLLTNGTRYVAYTRWGRVGERGQSAILGDGSLQDALIQFDKKFKDKSGLKWDDRGSAPKPKKYSFLEKAYEAESSDEEKEAAKTQLAKASKKASRASPPKCTLEPEVRSLMELIFNQEYFEQCLQDLNYDPNKMPLGKLSKATITRGYQTLKDLAALMNDPNSAQSSHSMAFNDAIEMLSNQFYSYIPHAFGRNRPPVIRTHDMLKREVDLMDSLTDLKEADQIFKAEIDDVVPVHPLDARYKGLGMQEMTPVSIKTPEFDEISQYLLKTCGDTHDLQYEVRDIFRIERQGETDRFEKSKFANIKSDRRLLWHGSRTTNFGGILSQGLRIAPPEAPVSGYMYGKGIYLADMSSKSANYCYADISGGEALLLLCDAELGQPMQELTDASYTAGEDALKKGMWSTWGKGLTGPRAWRDAGCIHPSLAGVKMPDTTQKPGATGINAGIWGLQYNEYIAYDIAQVRLRYLLRVKIKESYY